MLKKIFTLFTVAMFMLLMVACGGGDEEVPDTSGATGGNAAAGETLFTETVIGANAGCTTCHSLDGSDIVGPSLQAIGSRAGSTQTGVSAEDYLRASIVDPNAYLAEGFTAGIMPQNWTEALTDKQVDDLVSYLLTLK